MRARWHKHTLQFDRERGTSRGWLREKPSWFLVLEEGNKRGIGECGLLPGLSVDDRDGYESVLDTVIDSLNAQRQTPNLDEWPSIKFGLEMAQRHIRNDGSEALFSSEFSEGTKGIEINGLIWMGSKTTMLKELEQKLQLGFDCIKLKIGAIDWEEELSLLKHVRSNFNADEVTLRVDANGAFSHEEALEKLNILASLDLHSIEQPIKAGQWEEMARLCELTPLPIALDEELIGLFELKDRKRMIDTIKPQAIVLKPSLIGGFDDSDQWIELAEKSGAFWWITSALESNIGLNAIAQYTATKNPNLPQGLGTGGLYTNNFESPLNIIGKELFYDKNQSWDIPFLNESL